MAVDFAWVPTMGWSMMSKEAVAFVEAELSRDILRVVLEDLGLDGRGKRPDLAARLLDHLEDLDESGLGEVADTIALLAGRPRRTVREALAPKKATGRRKKDEPKDSKAAARHPRKKGGGEEPRQFFVAGEEYETAATELIRGAKDSVVFCSYVLKSDAIIKALCDIAKKRTTFVILDDRKRTKPANAEAVKKLEQANIEVYKGGVHAKYLVVDRKTVLLGSSNGTPNAAIESNILVDDESLAMRLLLETEKHIDKGRLI